jgi:hypothetical protein
MRFTDPDIPLLPGLDQRSVELLLRSVGSHQRFRPLQPLEIAHLIQKSLDAGATIELIRESIGLSKTMIGSFRRLLKLASPVQTMVSWKRSEARLTLETANNLAKFPTNEQEQIAKLILTKAVTETELRTAIQRSTAGNLNILDAIEEIVSRRAVIVERNVFIGSITNTNLIECLPSLTQLERDFVLKTICTKLFPDDLISAVLGLNQFTLILSKLPKKLSGSNVEKTVRDINDNLTLKVSKRDY